MNDYEEKLTNTRFLQDIAVSGNLAPIGAVCLQRLALLGSNQLMGRRTMDEGSSLRIAPGAFLLSCKYAFCPVGTDGNSPPIHRWEQWQELLVP